MIRDLEELAALPPSTVIVHQEKDDTYPWVYEKDALGAQYWWRTGSEVEFYDSEIELPVRVVWQPEWIKD